MLEVRKEVKNGVKWIYRFHPPGQEHTQPTNILYSMATYKCIRCGKWWKVPGRDIPLNEAKCITPRCSNPSLLGVLFRQLKGEIIFGFGRLVEAEIDIYATGK